MLVAGNISCSAGDPCLGLVSSAHLVVFNTFKFFLMSVGSWKNFSHKLDLYAEG